MGQPDRPGYCRGLSEERFLVPSVVGLTVAEAKTLLEANGITIGAVISTGVIRDTATAFVYKQIPPKFNEDKQPTYIKSGQLMDLFISPEMIILDSTTIVQ